MKRLVGLTSTAKRQASTASNHGGETLQRWRAVSNTASNLNVPGIKPQTSHIESDANAKKMKLNTSKGQVITLNVFAHSTVLMLSAVQLHAS